MYTVYRCVWILFAKQIRTIFKYLELNIFKTQDWFKIKNGLNHCVVTLRSRKVGGQLPFDYTIKGDESLVLITWSLSARFS